MSLPRTHSLSFERAAGFYDDTRGGLPRGRWIAAAVGEHLAPASRVLEIGVGTGLVALPLTEAGHTVLGADIAPAMLARARERVGARVVVGDAQRLPVASASVDAVVAVWVLHVVGDREAVIAECRRVLRPGGRLVVVPADARDDPDDMAPLIAALRRDLGRDRDLPDVVAAIARDAGFDLAHRGETPGVGVDESPEQFAGRLERREWSPCWELDDEQFDHVVRPHLDRLRALPEPERPRRRRLAHHVLVFARLR